MSPTPAPSSLNGIYLPLGTVTGPPVRESEGVSDGRKSCRMGRTFEGRTEMESESMRECINTDYTSTACLLVFCRGAVVPGINSQIYHTSFRLSKNLFTVFSQRQILTNWSLFTSVELILDRLSIYVLYPDAPVGDALGCSTSGSNLGSTRLCPPARAVNEPCFESQASLEF